MGGGLSGLATAFYLQQQPELRHAKIRLIEAQQELKGSYVHTAHADAAVLYSLLQTVRDPEQKNRKIVNCRFEDEKLPSNFIHQLQKTLQKCAPLNFTSVTPSALQQHATLKHSKDINKINDYNGSKICMEFGAGVPHLLSPGGGHVLRLALQLLLPSQLLIARRHAACLFSLIRRNNSTGGRWLSSVWLPKQQNPSCIQKANAARCSPGLSRWHIVQAVAAGICELFITKTKIFKKQQMQDMDVSSFAELHSAKAPAKALLLPAFSACSYAGQREEAGAEVKGAVP